MAVEDFGGKVLGRPIEILVADHQNKADIAAAAASKWFAVDHVTALLDVAASSPALSVMNVARAQDKIVLLNGPGATSITNESCIPSAVHYAYNTYALAHAVGSAVLKQGGKSWFFVTADYTFGHQLEADTAAVVKAEGGEVLGDARAPIGTSDFSSYLLEAQQSKAQVIAFANAGTDLINAIKQAAEFGLERVGAEARRAAGLYQRRPQPRPAGDTGHDAQLGLLLGPERRLAAVRQALLRPAAQDAQHVAGGRLFLDDALPEGGAGGRHHRDGDGDAKDARDAGRRLLRP